MTDTNVTCYSPSANGTLTMFMNDSEAMGGCNGSIPQGGKSGGSSRMPIFQIIMVVVYGILCLVGIFGNGLVIFVITRYTKMKTVTNMYILNLSIADGIFLSGLPMVMTTSVTRQWVFGYAMCKIYFMMTCINMFTGALTLTAMAGDRFLAVCYPIDSMRYRTPKYALIVITLIWIISFVIMLPVVLYAQMVQNPYQVDVYTCTINWPAAHEMTANRIYIIYTMLLGFVIPVLLIIILYTLLIVRLKTTGPRVKTTEKRRSHKKVTKLVTLIIGVFVICWLPYWGFQLFLIIFFKPLQYWQIMLFQVFTLLSYANSMINPLLYAFTNDNFRESFISAFRCASDPILGGRRSSDYVAANNNSDRGGLKRTLKAETTEYEFTMLNSSSGQDVNASNGKAKDFTDDDD